MLRPEPNARQVGAAVVLAGFPKCGSTSLHDWLVTHPRIVGAVVKEPHFFSEVDYSCKADDEGLPTHRTDGIDAYARLWPDAGPTDLRLDGTPFYLYYPTARDVLLQAESPPLTVAVVRQPSQRVFSLYSALQNRAGRLAHDVDFVRFLELVRSADARFADDVQVRDCIAHSDYRRWLEPWREVAGPDRVIVVTTDRLQADPAGVCAEIATALDIDPAAFATDWSPANVTYSARSTTLARIRRVAGRRHLLRHPWLKAVARGVYERVNVSDERRSPTEAEREAMRELDGELAAGIDWLADELGLDVGQWRE